MSRPDGPGFWILEWREMRRNSLLGFARVQLPSGMILNDVTVLAGSDVAWAAPPSRPMLARDGTAIKDASGKTKYQPVIEFRDKQTRDRFSKAVIDALRAAYPGALT